MKLYPEKLPEQLSRGALAPVYLIAGDEPFQVGEAADAVRAAARAQGFDNREVFFAERGFDWNTLAAASASMSLFAEKRLLEVRLPTGKPGDAGAKALMEFAERPPEDTVLMVLSARVDKRAKWVTALEKAGALVEIWPIERERLPGWIQQRLKKAGLNADREAAQLLADRVEGNLLAAAQEIDKLVLLLNGKTATAEAVRAAVSDSARYDVFDLVDAALAGQAGRALHILDGLRSEGVEPVLIVWALAREIRNNLSLAFRVASGESVSRVTAEIWPKKRQPVVARALERANVRQWERLLLEAALADRKVKGASRGDAWAALERLVAALSGQVLTAA